MRSRAARVALAAAGASFLGTASVVGALALARLAGPQGNGTGVMPNGWLVTPAGRRQEPRPRPPA